MALLAPVAVTGAGGQLGTGLLRRLAALGVDARPLRRGDELAPALADARAAVHLAGTLRPRQGETYEEANVGTLRATLAALERTEVERVLFVSYVGADAASDNRYLRAKGEAERLLYACGRDPVILRCTHVVGPPAEPGPTAAAMLARPGRAARLLGDGRQLVAPVFREDVVDALVAALDERAFVGRFDLAGPDTMSADELVRLLNGAAVRVRHLRPALARALARLTSALTPELVSVMAAPSVADPVRAVRAYDLRLRSLREVWAQPGLARAA